MYGQYIVEIVPGLAQYIGWWGSGQYIVSLGCARVT